MATSGWQVQGNAAEAYEAYLVPAIFRECARGLVDHAGVGAGQRVLDVACGTGVVARTCAERVGSDGEVSGVDLNPDMLAVARTAASGEGHEIAWYEGDATALPFDDDHFDVVLCEQALQFFPDRVRALAEMARVTRPGGTVAFSVFRGLDRHPPYAAFADALAEHVGSEAAQMMRSPFAFPDGEAQRVLAEEAGLGEVSLHIQIHWERFPSVAELVRQEALSSPLSATLAALPEEVTSALVATLERTLAGSVDDDGVIFANETHVVRGRA